MIIYEGLAALLPKIAEHFQGIIAPQIPPICHSTPDSHPTFFDSFSSQNSFWSLDLRGDRVSRFVWGNPAQLFLQGNHENDSSWNYRIGPSSGSEIVSDALFGFGTYRFRLQFSSCDPLRNEDLVNGAFLYFNNGVDSDSNGMTDNSEIDFEFLCGEPHSLYITSWTDYEDARHFQKITRRIRFDTGEIFQTPSGYEGSDRLERMNWNPSLKHPQLAFDREFHEMGFHWSSRSLEFFLRIGNEEQRLWRIQDPRRIPQHPGNFRFNLWHPQVHWMNGEAASYPRGDSEMRIECLSYEASR